MNARVSPPLSASLFVVALFAAGCDDSLKDVSLIEETRVLGARVESQSDPVRGAPLPGETASLRLFVVAPDGAANFSYGLSVCAVRLTNFGFPPCASAPFASTDEVEASRTDAHLEFVLPADIDLQATPHAFAHGLVCPDSGLNLAPDGSRRCSSGTGKEVAFEFPLGGTEDDNKNPAFGADALLLDGEPWPAANDDSSCDVASLPRVKASTVHAIRVTLPDADYEPLPQSTSVDPARETLLVSPFASAGKLEHGFLSLSVDSAAEERRINWSAPSLADGLPRLVHFYFVVRDQRSGEDFTSRAACVVP